MTEDIAYDGRVKGRMFWSSQQEDGLNFRVEFLIHLPYAALKFKVGGGS